MTEKLNKEFIPRLLDHAIKYHARRGIRWWCDCSFCTAKKIGTRRIGNYHRISPAATSYSNKYPWKASFVRDPDAERFLSGNVGPLPRPYSADNSLADWKMESWRRGSAWEIEEYYRRLVNKTREAERVKLRQELAYQLKQVF